MAVSLRALKSPLNNVLGTSKLGNLRSHTGLLTLTSVSSPCSFYVTLTSSETIKSKCLTKSRLQVPCSATQARATSSVCLPVFCQQTETFVESSTSRNDVFQPELLESFCPLDVPKPLASEHAPFSFLEYHGLPTNDITSCIRTVPTTVLSGYLGAHPYQVYCFNADRSAAEGTALSDYEKQILRYADADVNKQGDTGSAHPGKASEEQLQKVFNTLAANLPNFFAQPHAYSLYHKDIVFHNNIRGVTTHGIAGYVQQLALVRILGHLRYAHVKLEILKMTLHKDDGTIRIRWRITGVSGLRVLFMFWKFKIWQWRKMMNQEAEWTDGFSVMYVGADGLIYRHDCDKIMPDDEPEKVKPANVALKLALMLGLTPQAAGFGGADGSFGTLSLAADSPEQNELV